MVRHHVAQCAGRLVEGTALLDADRLGRGDLDVVDMRVVPDWLEDAVGEADGQDRLHCLLPEEMVDPVDLVLAGCGKNLAVERLGRGQVAAEGLLDHDPPERASLFLEQAGPAELRDDRAEEARGHRQVEDDVATQSAAEGRVGRGILEIDLEVAKPRPDPIPGPRVYLRRVELRGRVMGEGLHGLGERGCPALVSMVEAVEPQDGEVLAEQAAAREIVERRHQQALRQVAARAEDDERAGRRRRRGAIGATGEFDWDVHLPSSVALQPHLARRPGRAGGGTPIEDCTDRPDARLGPHAL